LQQGWEQTFPRDGAHSIGIDGNPVTGIDFGNKFIPTGAIDGTKWSDENGDGKQSNNETGLAGWTIYLDQNGNGQPDAGEPSTVTGQNGSYQFINLPDGNYIVREVLQQGWEQTFPRDGSHSISIDRNPDPRVDFGSRSLPTGALYGTKWRDENGDGKQNNNEAGLRGWTIYLDQNGNGQPDAGEPSTVTGQNGSYQFTNLPDGNYIVREVLQQGWEQTFPRDGSHSISIDGNPVTGVDFGNKFIPTGAIFGTKWRDENGDGKQNNNEAGLRGWTIYLDQNGNGQPDA
ncbi:MAG: hypothetical protein GY819_17580, partial [Planctomycetaceae bacterium]|nr:hypothetical protein [Planctomycetaceae bacterium]